MLLEGTPKGLDLDRMYRRHAPRRSRAHRARRSCVDRLRQALISCRRMSALTTRARWRNATPSSATSGICWGANSTSPMPPFRSNRPASVVARRTAILCTVTTSPEPTRTIRTHFEPVAPGHSSPAFLCQSQRWLRFVGFQRGASQVCQLLMIVVIPQLRLAARGNSRCGAKNGDSHRFSHEAAWMLNGSPLRKTVAVPAFCLRRTSDTGCQGESPCAGRARACRENRGADAAKTTIFAYPCIYGFLKDLRAATRARCRTRRKLYRVSASV